MGKATTSHVFMIQPVHFRYNEQTADDNAFQVDQALSDEDTQGKALAEFNGLVRNLREVGVNVLVIKDLEEFDTPDSIFPNNWISTHESGVINIFPMFAPNRRKEVRMDIVKILSKKYGFSEINDWTVYVNSKQYLEGTGSMVMDREKNVAYAALSERTHEEMVELFCKTIGAEYVTFHAVDPDDQPIYHTNVMMNIGKTFVIVCLESIQNPEEKEKVLFSLQASRKKIIDISYDQLLQFAGNMLELSSPQFESILVMSQSAYDSLSNRQITELELHSKIIAAPIPTIETNGGGSVRCMIAEIFPPEN